MAWAELTRDAQLEMGLSVGTGSKKCRSCPDEAGSIHHPMSSSSVPDAFCLEVEFAAQGVMETKEQNKWPDKSACGERVAETECA